MLLEMTRLGVTTLGIKRSGKTRIRAEVLGRKQSKEVVIGVEVFGELLGKRQLEETVIRIGIPRGVLRGRHLKKVATRVRVFGKRWWQPEEAAIGVKKLKAKVLGEEKPEKKWLIISNVGKMTEGKTFIIAGIFIVTNGIFVITVFVISFFSLLGSFF